MLLAFQLSLTLRDGPKYAPRESRSTRRESRSARRDDVHNARRKTRTSASSSILFRLSASTRRDVLRGMAAKMASRSRRFTWKGREMIGTGLNGIWTAVHPLTQSARARFSLLSATSPRSSAKSW
jgi:hypothetical protein